MNWVAVVGLVCAVGAILFGIMLGSPLHIFIDLPSLIIGPVVTVLMLLATYGPSTVRSAFSSGARGLLGLGGAWQDAGEAQKVNMVASSGIRYSMLTGFIGGMIGLVHMLTNMEDPTAIGPALAVCLLSAFYAGVMVMLVYYPMARTSAQHGQV